ncbi:DUF6625 family protein [Pontiella agarivorans]|uniref:Uncharacterized protein n=1 Tax=Pontiella agarivorans TaxID=3038953 RepID=A0ABU5MU64_9BACT|nr:DUF6625 family protein [Pontiella agarivorans]MDZ8117755.1 hypothetical protein [Pontiella agarivorans]
MNISIFVVYFGNLPPFVPLFLSSCASNPAIDFLLLGDAWLTLDGDVPENCRVLGIGLDEFKERAYKATGIMPGFSSPYKLCDYKPVLGEIFGRELSGFDYWGFCDTDIVLGDVMSFLGDLESYDIFSTSREYLSGPLFFFRNTERINKLYSMSKDVEKVMSSEKHYCFDECSFAWSRLLAGQSILEVDTEIESMTEVIVKAQNRGEVSAHFKNLSLEPPKGFKGTVSVDNGRVLMNGQSYIHYHHLHNKGRSVYTYPKWHWSQVPESYWINCYGVFGKHGLDLGYRFNQYKTRWLKRVGRKLSNPLGRTDYNATKIT